MNEPIKNISLKFSCDADWDAMSFVDGVKHCEHCHKKVYDFTDTKQHEFLMILAENNNNICGRFSTAQMAPKHINLPAWKKWASAAVFLIGINIFSDKADAQNIKPKTTKQNISLKDTDIVVGEPTAFGGRNTPAFDHLPEYPGGPQSFLKFVIKNLHYTKEMINGKVIVSFDVNVNGKLSNFKIIRGLNTFNNNEVIRVLKLSPKWQPATLKGKPVVMNYAVPVNFEK